jgi:hypothetical protein
MTNPAHPEEKEEEKPPRKKRDRGPPTHAFTIAEFCDAHRLSRSAYYTLKKKDRPREARVGSRVLITVEAATRWRKTRERKAATAA